MVHFAVRPETCQWPLKVASLLIHCVDDAFGYLQTAVNSEILVIEPKMRLMPFESAGDLARCGIPASSIHGASERLVLPRWVHLVDVAVDVADLALLDVQTVPAQLCSSFAELPPHLEA